ncbi:MAG: response regulator transcription factor [Angelakisella sp.]
MSGKKVLIVDDEPHIMELLRMNMRQNGYDCLCVASGEDALTAVRAYHPDVVLLDVMLPGISGLEVCRQIKQDKALVRIPVLLLTARSEENDRVTGLDVGADDYICKPFSIRELLARINAAIRRTAELGGQEPAEESSSIVVKDLVLDLRRHTACRDGNPVELTLTEFKLLSLLAAAEGGVVPRETLIGDLWVGESFEARSLDVHIRNLRRKLDDSSENLERYISTVRGVGYRVSI